MESLPLKDVVADEITRPHDSQPSKGAAPGHEEPEKQDPVRPERTLTLGSAAPRHPRR